MFYFTSQDSLVMDDLHKAWSELHVGARFAIYCSLETDWREDEARLRSDLRCIGFNTHNKEKNTKALNITFSPKAIIGPQPVFSQRSSS